MRNRLQTLVLALLLCSMLFATGNAETAAPQTRTIVDHNGNEVVIPAEINRIIISGILPLPSVYCLFEGDASKLVGMHPSSMAAARNSILPYIMPDVVNVNTSFATSDGINIEEVIALEPDVVFYNATTTSEYEMYKNAGIPAVGFSTTNWNWNCIETFNGWVELLGEVLQQEDKVDGIVEYGRQVEQFITSRIAEAGDIERPDCLVLFRYNNGVINTSGGNFFGQYWITSAGGNNVAKDLKGTPQINMEQIYEWNPDKIFITNFSPVLPQDLYDNVIEGQDWSNVKAVQNGEVYKYPLGMYRWFPPASDTPLVMLWMAKHVQPELFEDVDMDQEIRDYYQRFYNIEVTDEILEKIYNPSRDAAY